MTDLHPVDPDLHPTMYRLLLEKRNRELEQQVASLERRIIKLDEQITWYQFKLWGPVPAQPTSLPFPWDPPDDSGLGMGLNLKVW